MLLLIALVVLSAASVVLFGVNQGIEFQGGVRIPVTLERAASPAEMDLMVETIKTRVNKYGLSQSVVRPLGDDKIIVEIPQAEPEVIESVQRILKEQGHFEAVIDGNVALDGRHIMPGAVGGPQGERIFQSSAVGGFRWELSFAVTREGAEQFAQVALGKGDLPVYMFLDRPGNSVVVLKTSHLGVQAVGSASSFEEEAARDALKKEGDDIELFFVEDLAVEGSSQRDLLVELRSKNKSKAIVSANLSRENPGVAGFLRDSGFDLVEFSDEELSPVVFSQSFASSPPSVSSWKAVGLLTGPILSRSLADGRVNQFYQVSGTASGDSPAQQELSAAREIKELKSVISGGRLPVSTLIGSSFAIAPSLGERFLAYSWIGVVLAVVLVSLVIVLRYGKLLLSVPIVLVNSAEILITMAIVGVLGTLDLSAMAGIISMIGTGVDDQIILTDELLRKRHEGEVVSAKNEARDTRDRIKKGFYIVFTTAGVALVALLPLLLSGVVEIMGFALAAIIGITVGVLVTRPAYAVIAEEVLGKKEE